METNEKIKKNGAIKAIIILTILVVMVLGAGFAYARYKTRLNGSVTADIANYNFDVTVGNNTNLNIDLANTRLPNDTTKVASGQVAPDTKGAFNINVDATGSNVTLIYNIDLDLSGAPENLKFYSDANMKNEVMVQDDKIKIEDCIGINDTKTKTITLYWQWPYETGENDYEIGLNDIKDSAWMGHDIEIAVSATSKQVPEKVTYLADSVEIGDYVNYDATSGNGAGLTITPQESQTGSSTLTTFNSSDITCWRVYDIDTVTKTVTLIAEEPTENTLTLYGKTGWKYGVTAINSVGEIFGHGNGAYSGRSIQDKDIEDHSSYIPANYRTGGHSTDGTVDGYYYYTGNEDRIESETFTSGTFIMDDNTEATASDLNPITIRHTYYGYSTNTSIIPNPYYNLIGANKYSFWGATKYIYVHTDVCGYGIRLVGNNTVSYYGYHCYSSLGYSYSPSYSVRPMVNLKSNIQVTGQDSNNVWQLDVE